MNMKTTTLMAVLAFPLMQARAEPHRHLGTWEGHGTSFGLDGKPTGDFHITLTRAQVAEGVVETTGTVTLPSGERLPIQQTTVARDTGYRLVTAKGKGGGYCFGEGLCQGYEEGTDGRGTAHTLILDGEERMRVLITELNQGKAVRFMRQSLTRKR